MPQHSDREYKPRLCVLRKWDDFPGYGFNLQAEKGKPGQFIGNVDLKSPAEACGLKKNDRVIEVNGVNVCNESHKQVVARIRENPNEVALLLMDPVTEKHFLENGIVVKSDMDVVEKHEISSGSPSNGLEAASEPTPAPAPVSETPPPEVLEQEQEPASEEAVISLEVVSDEANLSEETSKLSVQDDSGPNEEPPEESPREEPQAIEVAKDETNEGSYTVEAPEQPSIEVTPETPPPVVVEPEVEQPAREESSPDPVEESPKVSNSGDAVTPTASVDITETEPTPVVVPTEPANNSVNGNDHASSDASSAPTDPMSIFQKPAQEVRAMHSRSKRRAIKETNQTFKEKYLVFENL